ncbi:TPA: retron Ec48 family effector membrane protein [Serratia fonticola]
MLKKYNLDKSIVALIIVIISISFIGFGLSIVIFISTFSEESLYSREICFSERCLKFFFSKTEGIVSVLQATAWLLTLITTVGGVLIAIMTYKTSVKNSNLTNHISHLNMFRDYINAEIGKRQFISSEKINIYKWYGMIFPESKKGDVAISTNYVENIKDIEKVVEKANYDISSPQISYSYNNHQRDLISKMDVLGIKISTGPKNEFILVEEQVFELIDCINITFTDVNIELSSLKRLYT